MAIPVEYVDAVNLGNKKKIHFEKITKLYLNEIFFIIFGLHGALAQLVRAADS